jgi:hypothetical protein
MNGDVVDDMVACGRAPHGLHGAVEPDHSVISRSSTVSIASSGRAPSGPVMRRIMAAPEQVCGGFVASDGDGHGGDDDVVELKITGLI